MFSCSSFAALFNPAEHRQMETQDSTPRRPPILGRHSPSRELYEVDRGVPLSLSAGYCNTGVIPVLRKTGRKQGNCQCLELHHDIMLLTSLSLPPSLPLSLSLSLSFSLPSLSLSLPPSLPPSFLPSSLHLSR